MFTWYSVTLPSLTVGTVGGGTGLGTSLECLQMLGCAGAGGALKLAEIVSKCLPRPKPGQSHPATRSFQAIRIAVNTEFQELADGLNAAERALKPGGLLAVVTFHSLEDRIVKRFFQLASGQESNANRYAPAKVDTTARFEMVTRKAVAPDDVEVARNPRARSAKLRVGRRTDAPALTLAPAELGLPEIQKKGRR